MLPDPRALPYVGDARWLGKIRATAAARYRDDKIDVSDCGAKVRKLIEEAVIADGIQILVKQVSLFTPEFDEKLEALKSDEARASEMEHAIKHEIHVKLEENPAFYHVAARAAGAAHRRPQGQAHRRRPAAQAVRGSSRREMRGRARGRRELGLSETGFAIYGLIADPRPTPSRGRRRRRTARGRRREDGAGRASWRSSSSPRSPSSTGCTRTTCSGRCAGSSSASSAPPASRPTKIDPMAESVVDLMKRRRGR